MSNNLDLRIFDEKEIVPNGKLEDLVTAALRLLDSKSLRSYPVVCYIFFGITDLLDVKQSGGYREVVLRGSGDTLLLSKIEWAVKTLREKKVLPVLCTFPPMSFAKHNQFLMKNGLTGHLQFKNQYPAMQVQLNEMVAKVNSRIEELNCESGVVTCQLSAKLFCHERGRYILRDVYLKDGLHPTNQGSTLLNVELAQNLRKAKQGKRSPDWLKKSHQVKSSSAVSFSIKKKPDEQVTLKEKLHAGRLTSATNKSEPVKTSRSSTPEQYIRGGSPRFRSVQGRERSPHSERRSRFRSSRSPPHQQNSRSDNVPAKPVPSHNPVRPSGQDSGPQYKAIKVPPPAVLPAVNKMKGLSAQEDKNNARSKTTGSFALSAFLGSLSGSADNQDKADGNSSTTSDATTSMSISPNRRDADPDIIVLADVNESKGKIDDNTDVTEQARSPRGGSRSRSRGRHERSRYRRSRSNERRRASPVRRGRSRSRERERMGYGGRRSRSDSRGRRRHSRDGSRDRNRRRHRSKDKSHGKGRDRSTDSVDRFGRRKDRRELGDDRFQTSSALLGDRPSALLGDAPVTKGLLSNPGLLEPPKVENEDDKLYKLAQEHDEMTGTNTQGNLETLSNLNQLSSGSDSLSHALKLQREALASKMTNTVEEQKTKILKRMQEKKESDPFDQALENIYRNMDRQNIHPQMQQQEQMHPQHMQQQMQPQHMQQQMHPQHMQQQQQMPPQHMQQQQQMPQHMQLQNMQQQNMQQQNMLRQQFPQQPFPQQQMQMQQPSVNQQPYGYGFAMGFQQQQLQPQQGFGPQQGLMGFGNFPLNRGGFGGFN